MSNVLMPTADATARMLEGLLGRKVSISHGSAGDIAWAGRYITRSDELAAVGSADMSMVALAGSALSMVPAGAAQNAANSGDPTELMVENFNEVLNVAASLIIDAGSEHVRLDGIIPAADLDEATAALAKNGETRKDFVVDIDGYGKGTLSFVTQ
jgi:hypothetical protein